MSAPSANTPPGGPSGRPPIGYTAAIAEEICERLAVRGESLTSICKSPGMPSYRAVMGWLDRYPKFAQDYTRARDIQTDLIAEEILDISDDSSRDWVTDPDGSRVVDHDHITRSRLRVDSRKWMAAKLKPKKYGEKVLHTGGDGEGPIAVKLALDYSLLKPNRMALLLED